MTAAAASLPLARRRREATRAAGDTRTFVDRDRRDGGRASPWRRTSASTRCS